MKKAFGKLYIYFLEQSKAGKERGPGINTMKYFKQFHENIETLEYDKMSGGSGAAMRTPCIGLIFY